MAMVDVDDSSPPTDSQAKVVDCLRVVSLYSLNEPGELSQLPRHDDSTINIVIVIIINTTDEQLSVLVVLTKRLMFLAYLDGAGRRDFCRRYRRTQTTRRSCVFVSGLAPPTCTSLAGSTC